MADDQIDDPVDTTVDDDANRKIRDHIPPPPPPSQLFMNLSIGVAGIVITIHIIRIWIYGAC